SVPCNSGIRMSKEPLPLRSKVVVVMVKLLQNSTDLVGPIPVVCPFVGPVCFCSAQSIWQERTGLREEDGAAQPCIICMKLKLGVKGVHRILERFLSSLTVN